jgi:branched-chain amino acid transport system substrate-binding protein
MRYINMKKFTIITFVLGILLQSSSAIADTAKSEAPLIKVGIASVLTGDLAILGQNVTKTVETYKKHYLRHNLQFVVEDAKLSSVDGLKAYQKLINIDHVGMIIGACSSNGTMAAKTLINSAKVPTVTIVTGGKNIDEAGEFVFRVGNSDTLNGVQEAQSFIQKGQKHVALIAEETEYTQDIAKAFIATYASLGGELVFNSNFLPGTADFRSEVTTIKSKKPDGIFMPTQTGTALGIFLKQWDEQQGGNKMVPVHTTFVAAPNPDAHQIAGDLIYGVFYMAPEYDQKSLRLKDFLEWYRKDHGTDPAIPFHTAGTVDTLDMLQQYLDAHGTFDGVSFKEYLLKNVKNYHGLMGTYSFDGEGNANLGFTEARIAK